MFFFFYSEIGELEHNDIVKSAFEKMMFEKLQSEGYCDINPLIGRPRTSKSEIENNLKKFDLVVGTMNNFYVNDNENIELCDDGFDKFFEGLFPKTSNITMK
mgnify:CR=1 FL=1